MGRCRRPWALRPSPEVKMPRTAMVLAAGLGKRMRPLTATRPKPLVEVAGRSLLDHALDRLRSGGIGTAIVNVHYFADALEAHRSEEHTSELQSLMRHSYAVFCLKKKKNHRTTHTS